MFHPRDLPLLTVFAAVARCGSFTAAARELGLAKSVVSEHVRTLESRCGARLLERSTRRLRLTQIGEQLLPVAGSVLDAARDVVSVLEEHRQAPVGTLRVATTHDLSVRFVTPLLARLAAQHRQLRVEVVSDDAPQDLIGGRFDVAVRLGAAKDSELVMRKLCVFHEPIVAAPDLAAEYGSAKRPRDLAGAPWVKHALLGKGDTVTFRGPQGQEDEVAVEVRARSNTGDGVRAFILGGVGLGLLPEYQVTAEIARGALVKVCPGWSGRQLTLYAVLPSTKRAPKRVEIFVAALKDAVSREGWSTA